MAVAAGDATCACGSALPLVRKILGRDRDIIVDGAGKPRVGYLFVELVKNLDLENQFQFVQPSHDRLIVRISNPPPAANVLTELREQIEKLLGRGVAVELELVDSVERDPSGKYRYVVSELSSPWGGAPQ
jgi:phenylacetate-CoA ligase